MPGEELAGAAIQAGASGAQTGGSIWTNKKNIEYAEKTNRENKDFAVGMYNKARQDALQDRDFENDYNSPRNQMRRMKEAGLNPRLIYGSGGATSMGTATRNTSKPEFEAKAPQIDFRGIGQGLSGLGNTMSNFLELQNLQAKTDNLRAQKDLIETNTEYIGAGIPLRQAQTKLGEYNFDLAKSMYGKKHEQAQANIDLTRQQITNMEWSRELQNAQLKLSSAKNEAEINHILSQMQSERISRLESLERIAHSKQDRLKIGQDIENMKQTLNILNQDEIMKKYHNEMYSQGMTPNDPAYSRAIIEAIGGFGKSDTSRSNQYKFEHNFKPKLK